MPELPEDLNDNPLLVVEGLPRFEQIKTEHIVPAVRHVLAQAEQRLTGIEQRLSGLERPSWDDIFPPLEELDRPFDFAWKPVGHLFGVLNSPELRTAYETVLPEVVRFGLRASQSRPIYEAIKRLDEQSRGALSTARQRVVDQKLLSAELSGIALEGGSRERFNAIAEELSQLSTDFSNHVLDATKAFELILTQPDEVAGLPPSLLQLAAQSFAQAAAKKAKERQTLGVPHPGPLPGGEGEGRTRGRDSSRVADRVPVEHRGEGRRDERVHDGRRVESTRLAGIGSRRKETEMARRRGSGRDQQAFFASRRAHRPRLDRIARRTSADADSQRTALGPSGRLGDGV